MDSQSFNQLPLTSQQSIHDMNIQMAQPNHFSHQPQVQAQMYAPQMIQQQQQQQQQPQMHQFQQPQMMMNHPQMLTHQYPQIPQQKPIYVYQTAPQQPSSRYSQPLYCSNCQRTVPSLVEFEAGKGAWVSGLVIGLLGCWAGCCLVPCCNEDFQDAVHSCTICHQKLGKRQFLFD